MKSLSLLVLIGFAWSVGAAPHLIFLLADDVGFGDVGYSANDVMSPTIDALAADGVKLGRHYT
jgi:arylsulfatase A-like enzyme